MLSGHGGEAVGWDGGAEEDYGLGPFFWGVGGGGVDFLGGNDVLFFLFLFLFVLVVIGCSEHTGSVLEIRVAIGRGRRHCYRYIYKLLT